MAEEEIAQNDDGDLVIQRSLVSYLDGIQQGMAAGFAEMRTSIANKADKSDFTRMEARLENVIRDVGELQTWRHDKDVASGVHQARDERASMSTKAKLAVIAGVLSIGSSIALAITAILSLH